jgi:hypothetical protein
MGAALVDRVEGSAGAKRKLRLFLETLGDRVSVVEASRRLGISEMAFYKARRRFLSESVELLEPRRPGRKPRERSPEDGRIADLEEKVRVLEREVRLREAREEIAVAMPRLVGRGRRARRTSRGRQKDAEPG